MDAEDAINFCSSRLFSAFASGDLAHYDGYDIDYKDVEICVQEDTEINQAIEYAVNRRSKYLPDFM